MSSVSEQDSVCHKQYCSNHCYGCDQHGYSCRVCRSKDSVCHKQYCSNHCYGCDQHGYSCRVCRSKDSVCHKQYCSNHCYGCDQHGYSCRVCRSKDSVCHKPFCSNHCYGGDQHGYSCRVCRSKDSVCHKQYCSNHCYGCDQHGYSCRVCRSKDSVCHKPFCSNHCYGCDQHGYSCRVCRSKDSVCHKQYCSNHCYGCDQHGYSCRVCRSKDSVCHKPFCNKHCHDCALQNVEDEVVEAVKAAISTCRFAAFADGLAPRHKLPPKWLLDKITACAKSIWQQDFIRLELQGSARKGTNIKGSDFDYHIVTSGPVELSDMHRLRDALSAPGIEVQEHIIVALKLKLHYDYTTTGSHFVTLELVPPEGIYFPPHADISKADPYFIGNRPAQRAVRVLKYLFSHCKPRLKSCFLEDLVKMADGRAPWNRTQQQSQLIEVDDFDSGLLLFEKVITDLQRHPHCSADSVIDRHRHMDSAKLAAMAKLALKLL